MQSPTVYGGIDFVAPTTSQRRWRSLEAAGCISSPPVGWVEVSRGAQMAPQIDPKIDPQNTPKLTPEMGPNWAPKWAPKTPDFGPRRGRPGGAPGPGFPGRPERAPARAGPRAGPPWETPKTARAGLLARYRLYICTNYDSKWG